MRDISTREMMTKLYRLVEKYEDAPKMQYTDQAQSYFERVNADCKLLYDEYRGNEFAKELSVAVCIAIGSRFKRENGSLSEREGAIS